MYKNLSIMDETESNVSFFRFEDLRIYNKAIDYTTWLYDKLIPFGEEERLKSFLKQELLKSAQNIALNAAEGSSRNKTQFLYYLKMAKSSVRECVVYTELISRQGLFDEKQKEYSRNQLKELTKMIGSLIYSLSRLQNNPGDERKDEQEETLPDIRY
jgi:four helix bundle protein